MKKWKRWLVLALATVLCLSLCGCDELDTMRANHAVWQEDGSVFWNGAVYRKLENVEEMYMLDVSYDHAWIYVTEPDVPVLLSSWFGEEFNVCGKGTLLEYYNYRLVENGTEWYCREDVYEETAEYLKNGFELATYFYSYYNSKDGHTDYYFTEYQTNAVNDVLTTVIPAPLEEYEDEPIWRSLYLNGCDESHRFSQNYLMDLWIMVDGSYFLSANEMVYPVPEQYNGIFNDITKAYVESIGGLDSTPTYVVN